MRDHSPCCSTHNVDMTCERYRKTHFVEVRPCCSADRARMKAEIGAIDVEHLARQINFSRDTFGPGSREEGVIDHIRKELIEVEDATSAEEKHKEWVDVIILAFDGAWRSGMSPEEIIAGVKAKQKKNESRTWPDWRTAEPGKAIEHDRSKP